MCNYHLKKQKLTQTLKSPGVPPQSLMNFVFLFLILHFRVAPPQRLDVFSAFRSWRHVVHCVLWLVLVCCVSDPCWGELQLPPSNVCAAAHVSCRRTNCSGCFQFLSETTLRGFPCASFLCTRCRVVLSLHLRVGLPGCAFPQPR